MESSYKLFISFLLLLPIASSTQLTKNSSIYQLICNKNFTTNDDLQQGNIDNTISSLVAKSNHNNYAISFYGMGYETIYGLIQCRGDISNKACRSCLKKAANQIRSNCPNSAESRIWYPSCFLRYDTYDFFGRPDASYTSVWPSSLTAADSESFNLALGRLLDATKGSAVGKDIKAGYCLTTEEKYNRTLYGIAQCTRDLTEAGCNYCLEKAMEVMSVDCKNHLGCFLISSCCMFRYEIYDLFREAEEPSAGPAASPSAISPMKV